VGPGGSDVDHARLRPVAVGGHHHGQGRHPLHPADEAVDQLGVQVLDDQHRHGQPTQAGQDLGQGRRAAGRGGDGHRRGAVRVGGPGPPPAPGVGDHRHPAEQPHPAAHLALGLDVPVLRLGQGLDGPGEQRLDRGRGGGAGHPGRQDQGGSGDVGHDLLDGPQAALAGQPQVHGDHVRPQPLDQGHRLERVAGLPDHGDVALGFEDVEQVGALHRRVLDHYHPHGRRHRAASPARWTARPSRRPTTSSSARRSRSPLTR
jgi:hypothetical protein